MHLMKRNYLMNNYRNTELTTDWGLLIKLVYKVDKKAMIRNRYNRIPYSVLNTKRERDTYN